MIGDDVDWMLPRLRQQAESRMKDTVTVGLYRDGTDEETGDPTRILVTARYAGKARIRLVSREVSNGPGVSSPTAVQEPFVSIPFGSARLYVGDEVRVTASPDPILTGRVFRITGAPQSGQASAHRYPAEELN